MKIFNNNSHFGRTKTAKELCTINGFFATRKFTFVYNKGFNNIEILRMKFVLSSSEVAICLWQHLCFKVRQSTWCPHVLIINNYSLLRRSIRYFVDLLKVFWLRWFPIVLQSTLPLLIVSLVNNFETSYIMFILGQHRKSPIQNRGSFKLLINLCRSWPMKMGVICFK